MVNLLRNKIKVHENTQFAVLGLGKFGRSLTKTLYDNGYNVLCCDINEHIVQEASEYSTYSLHADASDKTVLEKIGINNFDIAVIAFSEDFEAAAITATILKEMNVAYVLARVSGPRQKQILEAIGVDAVVLPEIDMGERIAYSLISNNLLDYIHRSNKHDIIEIKPLPEWTGKKLQDLRLRQTEGINIIAIIRNDEVLPVLDAETTLQENDNLIVLKTII